MTVSDAVAAVFAEIDAANAHDPNDEDGRPAALVYGERMSAVLDEFAPGASDHLRIAARGQHIERWTRPRRDWPDGRAGYLRWREELKRFHAERVAAIMAGLGWSEADCARTAQIVLKQGLKRDAEVQTLEDVACLVFIRWYLAAFAEGRDREQILDIVRKTGRKMSGEGRAATIALGLPEDLAVALNGG